MGQGFHHLAYEALPWPTLEVWRKANHPETGMPRLILSTFIATEPKGKQRPRFVRGSGRTYTPSETVKAEQRIQRQAAEDYPGLPHEGPIWLGVCIYLQKPKSKPKTRPCWPTSKPDWDNFGKLVSDALNGIVWRDDSQITRAFVEKLYCSEQHPKPGYRITVHAADLEEMVS